MNTNTMELNLKEMELIDGGFNLIRFLKGVGFGSVAGAAIGGCAGGPAGAIIGGAVGGVAGGVIAIVTDD